MEIPTDVDKAFTSLMAKLAIAMGSNELGAVVEASKTLYYYAADMHNALEKIQIRTLNVILDQEKKDHV